VSALQERIVEDAFGTWRVTPGNRPGLIHRTLLKSSGVVRDRLGPPPSLTVGGARTNPTTPETPLPRLRYGPAEHTIELTGGAMSALEREVLRVYEDAYRSRETVVETGGRLYACDEWDTGVRVEVATGPGDGAEHNPESFRHGSNVELERSWADWYRERAAIVGDWHSHPGPDDTDPSPTDMRGWASGLNVFGLRPFYLGIIVTPSREAGCGWHVPKLHGWAVYQDAGELVCAPARVREV
jgi:hypothetical protein